jgi:hypothetical protein
MGTVKIIVSVLAITMAGTAFYQSNKNSKMENTIQKKVNVWDTYVTKKDGNIMHFDIIAPIEITDTTTIYNYGKEYLKTKGQGAVAICPRPKSGGQVTDKDVPSL